MKQIDDFKNKIIQGDTLEVLKQMPDEVIDIIITSPPYWGLRNYNVDGQIGLEKTPEEYVEKLVKIFREARRVLKKTGTLWLNLGDSYNSHSTGNGNVGGIEGKRKNKIDNTANTHREKTGLKDKDLVGIPWRVAFALQQDGWYLRQDIIWAKPNPMPESVTDRCTKSHEYIFLLSKSPKYYFDNEAIKENPEKISIRKATPREKLLKRTTAGSSYCVSNSTKSGFSRDIITTGRKKRDVWWITTKPFKGAHFATFPPDLVETPINAGCPENGIVLDPFMGSGTTALVAKKLGKNYIGIELNPEYIKIAEARINSVQEKLKL
jgi:DNA modification methylase